MTGNTWQRGCRGKPTFIIQSLTSAALGWLSQAHETLFCTYTRQNTGLITAAEPHPVICFLHQWCRPDLATGCGDLCCDLCRRRKALLTMVLLEWHCQVRSLIAAAFIYSFIHSLTKQPRQAGWACCLLGQDNQSTSASEIDPTNQQTPFRQNGRMSHIWVKILQNTYTLSHHHFSMKDVLRQWSLRISTHTVSLII